MRGVQKLWVVVMLMQMFCWERNPWNCYIFAMQLQVQDHFLPMDNCSILVGTFLLPPSCGMRQSQIKMINMSCWKNSFKKFKIKSLLKNSPKSISEQITTAPPKPPVGDRSPFKWWKSSKDQGIHPSPTKISKQFPIGSMEGILRYISLEKCSHVSQKMSPKYTIYMDPIGSAFGCFFVGMTNLPINSIHGNWWMGFFSRGRRHAGQLEPHLDATKIFVFSFDRWKGSLIKSLNVGPKKTKQNSNSNKKN